MRCGLCKEIHCFYGPDKPDLSVAKYLRYQRIASSLRDAAVLTNG